MSTIFNSQSEGNCRMFSFNKSLNMNDQIKEVIKMKKIEFKNLEEKIKNQWNHENFKCNDFE